MKQNIQRIFLLTAAISSLFFFPHFIHSQTYQTFDAERDQILKMTRFRIGPFRIYPKIQLKNIGYDNNVYYEREEDAPASDFTGTLSPELKAYLLFRDWLILSLTENPEYVYYAKQRRERRWNNTLSPEFKMLFMNRFVVGGGYVLQSRRYRASSEFDMRANETREGYKGSLFYETARKTSVGFKGSVDKISYEDITIPGQEIALAHALDREERNGDVEIYYKIFSQSFFFVSGGYTEYTFSHADSSRRDSFSYQGYVGVRFPLTGRMRGTLALGYKKLKLRSAGVKGYSGLVGKTSLEFRAWRMGFRLKYERDSQFSYWTENIFFIDDSVGLGASYYLTRFLRLDYNFDYGESRYPEKVLLQHPDGSVEEILRKDIFRTHTVGIVVRVFRTTGVGLNLSFWERQSNYYWENRDRMFIGGYVTTEF